MLNKDSLCPIEKRCVLDDFDEISYKHANEVSDALKYSLRECIELLGNEVVYYQKNVLNKNLDENPINAGELTLECIRYMYRFLFILFIESRPELGYAPIQNDIYRKGYSLDGIRDVCDNLYNETSNIKLSYYIDDTIKNLFNMVYNGYPFIKEEYDEASKKQSNKELNFSFIIEPLKAHIFDPEFTHIINESHLRNEVMVKIVRLLSISKGKNKGRISYGTLGINQLGAVYEALLSYRGFFATEDLYEVKRKDETDINELEVGYFVKENELSNYDENERVRLDNKDLHSPLKVYKKGTFIYRLAGREREKSASYYTPEVLTKCLVKYSLKELLKDKKADDILKLKICEPAMGSAAFLNETINQLAENYINKKQEELNDSISYDKRLEEVQKVKMYIADNNVYGVDLNPIAVELAEVSLWLNTIYKGAYVPWFSTQLINGNSLIGARREYYTEAKLKQGKWYEEEPSKLPLKSIKEKKRNKNFIYHFLLGDENMCKYDDKVIKGLETENIQKIKNWKRDFIKPYDDNDIETLERICETIDRLWLQVIEDKKNLESKTKDVINIYGQNEVEIESHLTIREKDAMYRSAYKTEHAENAGPYARLKFAMDYWCSLWF